MTTEKSCKTLWLKALQLGFNYSNSMNSYVFTNPSKLVFITYSIYYTILMIFSVFSMKQGQLKVNNVQYYIYITDNIIKELYT